MSKNDHDLGMNRQITRRDFVYSTGLASLGLMMPYGCQNPKKSDSVITNVADYPPAKTGMRGSHPGSFETAHAIAREGIRFGDATDLEEEYDLVIVGGGISGLTAAYEYRKKNGVDSRILILDNHDDFGGHAKRNEFNQGGATRLSWGGTMNLEYLSFNESVLSFLAELGIDLHKLNKELDFHYGGDKPAIWFDADTYGKNVLIPGFSMYGRNLEVLDLIDQFPISESGRNALKNFYSSEKNVLEGLDKSEIDRVLHKTSYTDFLSQYADLPEDVVNMFIKATDGYWGVQTHSLSAAEAMHAWLPGAHRLGAAADQAAGEEESELVAMFPDGNATIARLLVHSLIPDVAPSANSQNIASAKFDYSKLDQTDSRIRIRLSSTVVKLENKDKQVFTTYAQNGAILRVRSLHAVLACYHAVIPHICPEIPEKQKEAQQYQVKHPMLLTNVLVRNSKALDSQGISGVYCPGRMHAKVWTTKGVNTVGYHPDYDKDAAVPLMFWGTMAPPNPNAPIHDQLRAARETLLGLTFEDFEREVRTVLDGILGPAGFDVTNDILAITVNRWPHGYSYSYMDLWDPKWEIGQAPHEVARKPIGNISIANSDAAASAYTQAAIEQAMRAVEELT